MRHNPLELSQIDKLLESFDFVTAGTQARYRLSTIFSILHMQNKIWNLMSVIRLYNGGSGNSVVEGLGKDFGTSRLILGRRCR